MKKRQSRVRVQPSELLFTTLAEQVKLPFVQVKHAAELLKAYPSKEELEHLLETITVTSSSALKMIDGYLLSVHLQTEPKLPLEPVSLGSVVYDAAQSLSDFAKAHDCKVELQVTGKFEPVMARREVVQWALESLGVSFIEAASRPDSVNTVTLAVRRTAGGITTGVYSSVAHVNANILKQARVLKGLARQPLNEFSAGSGAGVFVADALFEYLDTQMRVSRFQSLEGLAATLIPSRQLSLV